MNTEAPSSAWLARDAGEQITISGSCSLGRSPTNSIQLTSDQISRRHALIQNPNSDEYRLVDLGSRNGTYLNGRVINQSMRLRDGDHIRVGPFEFTFRQSGDIEGATFSRDGDDRTVGREEVMDCWLLLADIRGSTRLSTSMGLTGFNELVERWLNDCRKIIESNGGAINKFLGDGFLAVWTGKDGTETEVHRALQALRPLQNRAQPDFRVVLHFGTVSRGGVVINGEHYSGPEVTFAFRMESLAKILGEARLLSEPAQRRLTRLLGDVRPAGRHELKGFEGVFPFYAF